MLKKIQISDEYFWGFNRIIDITIFNSFDELGYYIKNELIVFLNENNLLNLVEIAQKLKLHNHNFHNYEDIYNTNDTIIYLCGGCN